MTFPSRSTFDPKASGECRDPGAGLSELPGFYADFTIIGGGGGSSVFEARHCKLNHLLAIKIWRPLAGRRKRGLSEDEPAEFLAAAASRASLEQAPFVEIHDFGVTPSGFPYLVMPRIFGVAIDRRICREVGRSGMARPPLEGMLKAPSLAHEAGAAFCFDRADFLLDRRGHLRIGDCGLDLVLDLPS